MQKTLKVINKLRDKGIIRDYVIGGGIATIFYVEPILTYDLDIFFIPAEEKDITTLSSIYEWLKTKGYKPYKEHVLIEGVPVQFIPFYNELIKDAIKEGVEIKYRNTETKVLRAEYLIAIMLQTFRPKDRERIIRLLDEAEIDKIFLKKILQRHGLKERFKNFMRVYYGK